MKIRSASMRSGLARAKGLGSASGGTEDFWPQRVTPVLGVPLVGTIMVVFWTLADTDYQSTRHLIGHPVVALLVVVAIVNFTVHVRLGAQIIVKSMCSRLSSSPCC
ncbi:succinate dehydrogenase, hydrophobic membrane anchor protein [Rhodopseudomonas pseudopalustris]|uniref:Succinate dehydrogenase hydrophobic membrane anchor subunit n=1 Tax=Rhodopseudomonas pseudopalustris TaxID=1513892 RepID=A0A1H8XC24_9BRAD|nr:succinate dehydrogenase, hydrophobic membrane anchor protein [Rhodopseudomonas pseudopalustris]SEP37371.1 succinate dehydrogenase / fumarate reductase membrane anchor subunit [Rhodopseudomonas pseudopalustris]